MIIYAVEPLFSEHAIGATILERNVIVQIIIAAALVAAA